MDQESSYVPYRFGELPLELNRCMTLSLGWATARPVNTLRQTHVPTCNVPVPTQQFASAVWMLPANHDPCPNPAFASSLTRS
ncbi:hypothetical protein PSAC2689_40313 [Paraburkholderia sacchari]